MHSVDNQPVPSFLAKSQLGYNDFELKYHNHNHNQLVWDFALGGLPSKSAPPVSEDVRGTDYKKLITELALQFHGPHIEAGSQLLGICAYCERLCFDGGGSAQNQVDHFRPRSSHNWLTFEWINLMYVCRRCNHRKDDGKVSCEVDQLGFVNPREPNAQDYFDFDLLTGAVIVNTDLEDPHKIDVAVRTIQSFNLDGSDINELRVAHLQRVRRDLSTKGAGDAIRRKMLRVFKRRKMPFSSLVRYAETVGYFDS